MTIPEAMRQARRLGHDVDLTMPGLHTCRRRGCDAHYAIENNQCTIFTDKRCPYPAGREPWEIGPAQVHT